MILLHLIQKIEETYTGGRAKWTRHNSNNYPPDSWRKKQWPNSPWMNYPSKDNDTGLKPDTGCIGRNEDGRGWDEIGV